MKMSTELATLAEAEDDIDEEDAEDEEEAEEENDDHDGNASSSEACTFNVPYFRYIDDEDVAEIKKEMGEGEWRGGSESTWCSHSSFCNSSYRYVVVSGTPLKILEHLLSDLRLDDQRAPENRESGKFADTQVLIFCASLTDAWH